MTLTFKEHFNFLAHSKCLVAFVRETALGITLVCAAQVAGFHSAVSAQTLPQSTPPNSAPQEVSSNQAVPASPKPILQKSSQTENSLHSKKLHPIHPPITKGHSPDGSTKSAGLSSKSKIIRLGRFGETESVQALGAQIAISQDLPQDWVVLQIAKARLLPSVVQQMMPAQGLVQKNWKAYRARFIEPKRIGLGVQFWQKNAQTLDQAEREFGVAPEIIVGILGVETLYGQHMGAYPVLDSLATLSLAFPKEHPRAKERQEFFQNELGIFLKEKFAHPEQAKYEVLGSYAGAIGAAQFMPSSLTKFAVDYDHDGYIDLIHSTKDAIGSVANYFKMFGWQPGMPTRFSVDMSAPQIDLEGLLLPDILPTFSTQAFEAKGVSLSTEGKNHPGPIALIELQNGTDAKEYFAGTENFYVVTRYNWSSYYAMAVLDLGEAVKQAYQQKVSMAQH